MNDEVKKCIALADAAGKALHDAIQAETAAFVKQLHGGTMERVAWTKACAVVAAADAVMKDCAAKLAAAQQATK